MGGQEVKIQQGMPLTGELLFSQDRRTIKKKGG